MCGELGEPTCTCVTTRCENTSDLRSRSVMSIWDQTGLDEPLERNERRRVYANRSGGTVEDLPTVPVDVLGRWCFETRQRLLQRSASELVAESVANLTPSDECIGDYDLAVGREPQHTQIEQLVVQLAERQTIGDLVRAIVAVPSQMGRSQSNGLLEQTTIPSAHCADVSVGREDVRPKHRVATATDDAQPRFPVERDADLPANEIDVAVREVEVEKQPSRFVDQVRFLLEQTFDLWRKATDRSRLSQASP